MRHTRLWRVPWYGADVKCRYSITQVPALFKVKGVVNMKNPNGYGSVYKLGGSRRRPYTVRITISSERDSIGSRRMKYKYLGYYVTREEAMIALAEYNKNPYDIDSNKITFAEIYKRWKEKKYDTISVSRQRQYNSAYKSLSPLHNIVFSKIRLSHLQSTFDNSGKGYASQEKMRDLCGQLFAYAVKHDVCQKNYSQYIELQKDEDGKERKHRAFTNEEIEKLWSLQDDDYAKCVLIMIYTGLRSGELLDLKYEDVHLDESYIDIKKSKTSAGVRKVPIAEKIKPLIKYFCHICGSHLVGCKRYGKMSYETFRKYWIDLIKQLEIEDNPTPHSTRYTCSTLLATAGVDPWKIRKILGHAGKDITESIYTDFSIDTLIEAINKI